MNFLVFIEQRDGRIRKASLEALSLACRPSGDRSQPCCPAGVAGLAKDLDRYGAGTVYVADRDDLGRVREGRKSREGGIALQIC